MKKIIGTAFALVVSALAFAQTENAKYSYEDLMPLEDQTRVEQFATQFLSNYHYKKFEIDDSLSSHIFDNYLDEIDGSRSFFTKKDIAEFEEYRFLIDEAILGGDLEIPFKIFNRYRKLYKERYDYILTYLGKPIDYHSNLKYEVKDEDDRQWADSQKQLDGDWDKILLNQALNLKLTGKADSSVAETLLKRYERYENRVSKWRSEDVFQGFMDAVTEAIDPHTAYMIPSNAAQFNIDMSQSLEGIGAQLRNDNDYVMIVDVIPGGPLFKTQQASKDDYILGVAQGDDGDFQDIVGWLTDDAVNLIRGKKGTVVRLLLKAKDAPIDAAPREVRIVREKIKLEEAVAASEIIPVKARGKEYKVGYIDLPMFYRDFNGARMGGDFQSTTKDVRRFLEEFVKEGVDGVMIDLRNNGGGSLTEAIDLTGLFIPKGPVVQRRSSRGRVEVEDDNDPSVVYDGPLLILQNRYSASASEIFAGAIQDYNRGLIVGEQSFGKGTVQQLVDLDRFLLSPKVVSSQRAGTDGIEQNERYGQLKLTTEKFYRITGQSTQRRGVIPDIELPSPWDSSETGESSRPTALPYDEIKSSSFHETNEITPSLKKKVVGQFQERLSTNEELRELIREIKVFNQEMEQKEFSLNYDDRLEEKEKNEKSRTEIKKLAKTKAGDDHKDDLYLNEAQQIMANLIRYK
ncbi:carboxy terminal-processing peptidase [Marinilongibacter aquaticus]|uniref:carboxy terminal-processing peptidase n=1 Tax=Marinilongibacter aquaticus TaxID=2975157 RepID=UPI0021BD7679|nr:carboxy terminal-processing peptidase [Marinilongibacter aquaticus]UBM60537.1 carboxy terminal-processing peptidase [Marinilongibacter aquaticus]